MTEQTTSAVWMNGYEHAIYNVLVTLRREFPNPTLGIKKAISLIEEMGKTV